MFMFSNLFKTLHSYLRGETFYFGNIFANPPFFNATHTLRTAPMMQFILAHFVMNNYFFVVFLTFWNYL